MDSHRFKVGEKVRMHHWEKGESATVSEVLFSRGEPFYELEGYSGQFAEHLFDVFDDAGRA